MGSSAPGPRAGHERRVRVIGDLAVDYYIELPAPAGQPASDEKITATSTLRAPGGTGANAAAAIAALGTSVTLYAAVGADPMGFWVTERMGRAGVSTAGVRAFPGPTTHATILLEGGTRRVIVDRGVADQVAGYCVADLTPGHATPGLIYVTAGPAAIRQVAAGRPPGSRLVIGVEAWMAGPPGLACDLAAADLVITNSAGWQAFEPFLAGEVGVVETRGADGAAIHHPGGRSDLIPGFRVPAVDATGAGDCFAGALCHYRLAGSGLTEAVTLASAAAALSTQRLGAQGALPGDNEVRALARFPPGPRQPAPPSNGRARRTDD